MLNKRELLKRIEALNRRPVANKPDPDSTPDDAKREFLRQVCRIKNESSQSIIYKRTVAQCKSNDASSQEHKKVITKLEDITEGVEVASPLGQAYKVDTRLIDHPGKLQNVSERYGAMFHESNSPLRQRIYPSSEVSISPNDVIFLDVETTGLSNSPVFLVGLLIWEDGGLVARQYFARNYAEESAIISLFKESMQEKRVLITFNGKSFDFPYLRVRAAANRIAWLEEPIQFDMLHECRRIYKGMLPDCKLQTLERHICGTIRYDDIPGNEIPDAYHYFVRTSDPTRMISILKHNAMDLITMADLLTRLP